MARNELDENADLPCLWLSNAFAPVSIDSQKAQRNVGLFSYSEIQN
ncbi:hypothetical protein IFVP408_C2120170 [Vibrio parahaemolyticus]